MWFVEKFDELSVFDHIFGEAWDLEISCHILYTDPSPSRVIKANVVNTMIGSAKDVPPLLIAMMKDGRAIIKSPPDRRDYIPVNILSSSRLIYTRFEKNQGKFNLPLWNKLQLETAAPALYSSVHVAMISHK